MDLETSPELAALQEANKSIGDSSSGKVTQAPLVAGVPPTFRGTLRRRTRFTRAWKSDGDIFEIRNSVLLLIKSGKSSGFLSNLFGKAGGAATPPIDADASNSTMVQAAATGWDRLYDLAGAIVESGPAEEKSKAYPMKIMLKGLSWEDKDSQDLNLCADSEEWRNKWLTQLRRAAQVVERKDFELLKTVGKGQWGKVFIARKRSGPVAAKPPGFEVAPPVGGVAGQGGDILAVKEIQLGPNTNVQHVQNERLIMEAISSSEFLVNMLYSFRTGRFLYFALDFSAGGDLFRHWRKYKDQRTKFAPFYAAEVLMALEHLHKHRVIYRDLKPENVLLTADGHCKVADLGLAKRLRSESDRTQSFCGTEAYLAPEMIMRLPYNFSVDLWQFGCFVFELYVGRSPFWLPKKPRKVLRESIINGAFEFSAVVPEHAKGLISGLLTVEEPQRTGCNGAGWNKVRNNAYFVGTDWAAMALKKIPPPVLPEDPGPELVNNFDDEYTQAPAFWGTDTDMLGNTPVLLGPELEGFSYVRQPSLPDAAGTVNGAAAAAATAHS